MNPTATWPDSTTNPRRLGSLITQIGLRMEDGFGALDRGTVDVGCVASGHPGLPLGHPSGLGSEGSGAVVDCAMGDIRRGPELRGF